MSEKVQGNQGVATVIWFSSAKGYGYLAREDGLKDLFVHYSNIAMEGFKTLKPGQKVSFELGANHKGEQAINVVILSEPEPEEK